MAPQLRAHHSHVPRPHTCSPPPACRGAQAAPTVRAVDAQGPCAARRCAAGRALGLGSQRARSGVRARVAAAVRAPAVDTGAAGGRSRRRRHARGAAAQQ
eukprot:359852-Chlamydomonas_euryale.AAC.1